MISKARAQWAHPILWLLSLSAPFLVIGPAAAEPGAWATPVEVADVAVTTLVRRVETLGTLLADESVVLRPELGGRVAKIHFKEGQQIKKGRPLISLDTSIHKAELVDTEARTALAKSEYRRLKDLNAKGMGSAQDLDRALAELRRARASETLAKVRLDKMTLRAPFSGTLGLRQISPGDYLQPGQSVVDLVATRQVKLDFQIPERYAAAVRPGQLVSLQVDAWPGRVFKGQVYAIAPEVDISGRSLKLRARLDNQDGALRPGLFARVSLTLQQRNDALTVPEQALVPEGEARFVYRVVDGKALRTEVKTGLREGTRVEILSGLQAGDQVVTAGQIKIKDGAAVQPVPDKS